ncbi:hypothetical protein HG535_0A05160 [Zygotorulaspora mrakii]|uniref:Protein CMS1 n=1 Tax=Zygotorulaspora mrakii TaxID=42260 RepID=A0A7H9AW65_ZYGMR|nr:uncharacterized protein HG535_0A05160 [Zygotorulaspora mrakii]QLG70575.1 hypothetical protein HG535_0A05160 [Zygotorulaspora mrakii]
MSNSDDLDGNVDYDYESEPEIQIERERKAEVVLKNVKNTSEEEEEDVQNKLKRSIEADDTKSISKRKKKLMNSKFHDRKREQIEYDIEQKKSIPKSSPEAITEYFAKSIRENNPDLSPLELNEMYLKRTDFLSTEKFDQDRDVLNFTVFMTQFSKAPKCIILSMSNIRVADLFRGLGGSKNCLKLFAKNKFKDDLASVEECFNVHTKVKSKDTPQAVKYFIATPTRMAKLLEATDVFFQGKDKLDIILDASYLDPKNNTLLKCENTKELCKVLRTVLNKKSSVKVLLY